MIRLSWVLGLDHRLKAIFKQAFYVPGLTTCARNDPHAFSTEQSLECMLFGRCFLCEVHTRAHTKTIYCCKTDFMGTNDQSDKKSSTLPCGLDGFVGFGSSGAWPKIWKLIETIHP